jgi:hypothetical protein
MVVVVTTTTATTTTTTTTTLSLLACFMVMPSVTDVRLSFLANIFFL